MSIKETVGRIVFAPLPHKVTPKVLDDIIAEGTQRAQDATLMGSEPWPHLHIRCSRCEYEWLERPAAL